MFAVVNELWNASLRLIIAACEQLSTKTLPRLSVRDTGMMTTIRRTLAYAEVPFDLIEPASDEADELRINETPCIQPDAMFRAACKLARTYPTNVEDAAVVDQWMDLHAEFMVPIHIFLSSTRYGPHSAWYDADVYGRWLHDVHIPKYLSLVQEAVDRDGWLGCMDRLSMADLRWFETLSWLKCSCPESIRVHTLHEYPSILSYLEDITNCLYYNDVSEDGDEDSTEDEHGAEEAERKCK